MAVLDRPRHTPEDCQEEDMNSAMLDGVDVLCCTATGDGKSAAFSVPILVLNEYNANPALYPAGLPTRKQPVGLVITPTKGLAGSRGRSRWKRYCGAIRWGRSGSVRVGIGGRERYGRIGIQRDPIGTISARPLRMLRLGTHSRAYLRVRMDLR
ncbi:hypothetical protein C8R47DRAFT_1145829 [Mycena vitilis]|nr:hypothetical protein C8R47DRAFT_1145829 [Mycena vitilis]